MKKLIYLLPFVSVMLLQNNYLKAQGNTCNNAVTLQAGSCINDSIPADSMKWYTFKANQTITSIRTVLAANSIGHVHTITLYSSCTGVPIKQVSVNSNSQDTLILNDSSLSINSYYFVEASDNIPGCIRCAAGTAKYQICRIQTFPDSAAGCMFWNFNLMTGDIQNTGNVGCCCPYPRYCGEGKFPACNLTVCLGTQVNFSFNPTGIASSYLTILDTANHILLKDTVNVFTFTFDSAGSFGLTFLDSVNNSLTGGNILNVLVVPLPKPTFTINPNLNPICIGDIITLTKTDSTPSYQSWGWQAGGVFLPYGQQKEINPYTTSVCSLTSGVLSLIETNGGNFMNDPISNNLDITGCAAVTTDTLNEIDFNPSFTFTYPCSGGPIRFANTTSCPDSTNTKIVWSWNFGDTASGANDTSSKISPLHTFSGPGTYTVTLSAFDTSTLCGSSYASTYQIVKIYPSLSLSITGPNLTCLGSAPYTYCDSVKGGSGSYTNENWSVTGGSFTSTGNCIQVTFEDNSVGGVIYFTATDKTTGCTITDSLVVRGCCSSSFGSLALEDDSLSGFGGKPPFAPGPYTDSYHGGTWSFTNFSAANPLIIDGVFKVDQNMDLGNSVVVLGTNAQIIITAGHSLSIIGSYIHACANMWDGIYIEPGATLTIAGASLIEDAQNAVVSVGGGTYLIGNCTFNKDYRGVVIKPYSAAFTGNIFNTTFACNVSAWPSHVLHGPTTLIAPYAGIRSDEGVEVDSVNDITIGRGGFGLTNTFKNLAIGINSYASDITIINNDFNDNTPTPASTQGFIAVYVKGDATGARRANIGTSYQNTYENWGIGVFVRDTTWATIEHNIMDGVETGIQAWNNFHTAQQYNHNTIGNVFQYGINCYNNLNARLTIVSNTLSGRLLGVPATGIIINEITPAIGTGYVIQSNTIFNVANGVFANNLYSPSIKSNDVGLNNKGFPGFDEGIYSAGTFEGNIVHNTVLGSTFTNSEDGIFVNGGPGSNFVACNQTIRTNNGCSFSGPSVSTQLIQNQMSFNGNGLLLFPSTPIGNQGALGNPNDNQWFGCVFSTNAIAPLTQFFVRPLATYDPLNNSGGGIHFDTTSGTSCYSCSTGTFSCGGGGGLAAPAALQVVSDSMPFTAYPSTSHWLQKHSLYKYLVAIDSSLLANAVIKHFRDSARVANMGKLEEINTALADSDGVNSTDIETASNLSSTIVNPDSSEQISQVVENIIISMQRAHSNFPNTSQISILQNIAPLCPAQYGDAVFIARSLLSQVDTAIYVSSCENIESRSHRNPEKPDENGTAGNKPLLAKVYPNPASTILNVQVQLASGQVANICLYNTMGQQIRCNQLVNSITTIPISTLPAGIYFYRITDMNGNLIREDKQVIIH